MSLPNVSIRRLGDSLEVSWDNETWGSGRPSLSYVEKRGTELVGGAHASEVLLQALGVVTSELVAHEADADLDELALAAKNLAVQKQDWKWLIHRQTAQVIDKGFKQLKTKLEKLICPKPAPVTDPYKAGYEHAGFVRDALGWGDEPAPDLMGWMSANNVLARNVALPTSVVLVASRDDDARSLAVINQHVDSQLRRETAPATALGHILMDEPGISVDGTWEHWPTAARARAFGIMLLLPYEGVRKELAGRTNIDASDVQRLMNRFKTGPWATTYHLKNLALIDEERRHQILLEMRAQ